jgi:hypothetical protein
MPTADVAVTIDGRDAEKLLGQDPAQFAQTMLR